MKREKFYTEIELKKLEELKQKKEVLKSQMAEIQKEINKIIHAEAGRNHHRKTYIKHPQKSKAFEMYGKHYKELTDEERKEYWKIIQREHRRTKAEK